MTQPENRAEALDTGALQAALNAGQKVFGGDLRPYAAIITTAIRAYLASLPEAPAVPVVKRPKDVDVILNMLRNTPGVNQGKSVREYIEALEAALQSSPPVKAAAVDGEVRNVASDGVDRNALKAAYAAYDDALELRPRETAEAIYDAIAAYVSALASQHAVEGEAVAWRWRYADDMEWRAAQIEAPDEARERQRVGSSETLRIFEPLFTRPAAADAGVRADAEFLLDRLAEFEREIDGDWQFVTYNGHVSPAIARLRSSLSLAAKQERTNG